jgi:hypothetical protein
MCLDDAPGKRQPDTRPAMGSVGLAIKLMEWLESVINLGFGHA